MTSKNSANKFDKARDRLSLSLQNLENTIKEKLHEAAIQSKLIDVSKNDLSHSQSIIVEQTNTIQNLNHEINNLQNNMVEMSKEIEFLNEKNQVIAQRMKESQKQQKSLLEAIEKDLLAIEELINDEE
jgi:predicted RNase H-like nuclease (RuvC/YqgF family)